MIRRPPRPTRTDTLFPYTTLFRSPCTIVVYKSCILRLGGNMATPVYSKIVRTPVMLPESANARTQAMADAGYVSAAWIIRKAVVQFPDERSAEHTSELQSLMRISYAVFCLQKKHHIAKIDID